MTADQGPQGEFELKCPRCGGMTNSLKKQRIMQSMICLLVWRRETNEDVVGCPSCVRSYMWKCCLNPANIVSANVMWIFHLATTLDGVLPTYRKGHSGEVLDAVTPKEAGKYDDPKASIGEKCCSALIWLGIFAIVFAAIALLAVSKRG